MLVTAASLYLPDHIAVIYNRIWYYVHGEFTAITGSAGAAQDTAHILKTAAHSLQAGSTFATRTTESVVKRAGEL